MVTKTFQAETMMEALKLVQSELGPDAIIVSARSIPRGSAWQVWRQPGVEVISMSADETKKAKILSDKNEHASAVIRSSGDGKGVEFIEEHPSIDWAVDEEEGKAITKSKPQVSNQGIPSENVPASSQPVWSPIRLSRHEVAALNKSLTENDGVVKDRTENKLPTEKALKPLDLHVKKETHAREVPLMMQNVIKMLSLQGIDHEYLVRLQENILNVCQPELFTQEKKIQEYLMKLMAADLRNRFGAPTAVPNPVLALVGPSGSGKSSTIAKLAVYYGQVLAKKVVWICGDTIRTGAIAEARKFTETLGIPLELVYTPPEVRLAINKHRDADLILVDSTGFNPYDEAEEIELGAFLSELASAHIYFVAPASAKESDLMRSIHSLKAYGLKGIIFSKLDETCTYGNCFNLARKSQLPLTYFTVGKKATGSLQLAEVNRLVAAVFGEGWHK